MLVDQYVFEIDTGLRVCRRRALLLYTLTISPPSVNNSTSVTRAPHLTGVSIGTLHTGARLWRPNDPLLVTLLVRYIQRHAELVNNVSLSLSGVTVSRLIQVCSRHSIAIIARVPHRTSIQPPHSLPTESITLDDHTSRFLAGVPLVFSDERQSSLPAID